MLLWFAIFLMGWMRRARKPFVSIFFSFWLFWTGDCLDMLEYMHQWYTLLCFAVLCGGIGEDLALLMDLEDVWTRGHNQFFQFLPALASKERSESVLILTQIRRAPRYSCSTSYSKRERPQPRFHPILKLYLCFGSCFKHWISQKAVFPYNFLLHKFHKPVLWKNTVLFTFPHFFHISLFLFFFAVRKHNVFHIFISITLYFYFKRIISNIQDYRENHSSNWQSFTQLQFIEHLLCIRYFSRFWE